jgi:hypothetical protein
VIANGPGPAAGSWAMRMRRWKHSGHDCHADAQPSPATFTGRSPARARLNVPPGAVGEKNRKAADVPAGNATWHGRSMPSGSAASGVPSTYQGTPHAQCVPGHRPA